MRLAGRAAPVGAVENRTAGLDVRTPWVHLSRDGRVAWALHREWSSPAGKFFQLGALLDDPVISCTMPSFAMGIAEPAFSGDDTFAVGTWDARGTEHSVVRMQRITTWCAAAPNAPVRLRLASMAPMVGDNDPVSFGIWDVTVSADGRVAAWTSQYDHCAVPATLATRDLWLWYDDGLTPPSFAAQTCPAAGGVGTLARISIDAVAGQPTEETFSALSSSASFLAFISTANINTANLFRRPMLYELPLAGTMGLPVPLSTGLAESVGAAALSRDERVVTYTLDRDADIELVHLGDNFVVVRDVGSQGMTSDNPALPPADEPFDLELRGCSVSAGTAFVDLRLRQWRGGGRAVVLTAEVEDTVTAERVSLGPIVQRIGDGQVVDVTLEAPFGGTAPACTARGMDGATSHPNVVPAWGTP